MFTDGFNEFDGCAGGREILRRCPSADIVDALQGKGKELPERPTLGQLLVVKVDRIHNERWWSTAAKEFWQKWYPVLETALQTCERGDDGAPTLAALQSPL